MSKTTLVTAFFDLSKLPDATSGTRDLNFYLEHGKITLGVHTPMVIFCDQTTYPKIQAIRQELIGKEEEERTTKYVVKSIINYEYYQNVFPSIIEYRAKLPGYKEVGERNTPSYYLTVMFKFHALHLAYNADYFPDCTHFAWMDFGGGHVMREPYRHIDHILANPKPNVGMGYISYTSMRELEDYHYYLARGGYCGTCGIFFTVQRQMMVSFIGHVWGVFYELMGRGYGHADEQVVIYVVMRYPKLFSLHFCDYYSVLSNYYTPTEDLGTVLYHGLEKSIKANDMYHAKMIASQLKQSLDSGKITLDDNSRNKVNFILSNN